MTKGSAGSLLLGTILIRASYKRLMYALWQVPSSSSRTSSTMVLGMFKTHCKHYSLIPPLVSNNNLALLRCGYICAGMLVHISRHLGKISNNNNKICQLCIRCMLDKFAFVGFYIRFLVFNHYYIITAYILLYHLCSIPPVSSSYLIILCVFPA